MQGVLGSTPVLHRTAWEHTLVILAFGRLRQENKKVILGYSKFKVGVGYMKPCHTTNGGIPVWGYTLVIPANVVLTIEWLKLQSRQLRPVCTIQ